MYHEYQVHLLVEEALANAVSMANALGAPEVDGKSDAQNKDGTSVSQFSNESGSDTEGKALVPFNKLQKARCHWIQLAKLDLQLNVIQQLFANVFEDFEQMRPLWKFGKSRNQALYNDPKFYEHCSYFQAALTLIMEYVDDPTGMWKFTHDIGARHFFYDVYEPHTKVICSSMMKALREVASADMNREKAKCWHAFLRKLQAAFDDGLASQRHQYLQKCIVPEEMEILMTIWEEVRMKHMKDDGSLAKCSALMYKALKDHCQKIPRTATYKRKLEEIADATINAVLKMIEEYDSMSGFSSLPNRLKSLCRLCCTLNESPRILRQAFNEGFANIMTSTLHEDMMNAGVKQIWCKVARILEQVIKDFIVRD